MRKNPSGSIIGTPGDWRHKVPGERQTSIRFHPVLEDQREVDEDVLQSPPQREYNREQPIISRVSMMFTSRPEMEEDNSCSSLSPPIKEPPKQQDSTAPQQNSELLENPHALLLLLRQRDLEIKGLKNAAQKDPYNRLGCILQEIVKPTQKGPPKKSPTEVALQEEVNQLNEELKAIKNDNEKKIKELENKLVQSKLHVLHLQKTVRALSAKSDEEIDTDSTLSLDERTKLAYETFELWSETGNRVTSDTSDLRLRRVPKHTSFVDAFHKFGSVVMSEEDKKEILSKLEAVAEKACTSGTTDESSLGSSRADSQLPSEQSSWTIIPSQKSVVISSSVSETKMTESSKSVPSSMETTQQEKNVHVLDPWHLAQAGLTLGQLSDGEKRAYSVPSVEGCKRCRSVTGSLRIVSVHRKGKFVRIFNALLTKEVDLSGYIIQQSVGGYPVSVYRFPRGTILPAQHHITVWAAVANLAHEQPSDPLSGPRFFRAGPECVTVLYDHSGQVVSQHTNPHQFTAAAEAYSDNVDLSIDKFPLNNDEDDEDDSSRIDVSFSKQNRSKKADSGILVKRRYSRHFSIDASATTKTSSGRSPGTKAKIKDTSRESTGSFLYSSKPPSRSASETPSSSSEGDYFAYRSWKPLVQEPEAREFKTTLDTTLPIVSLIGQKSARSRYGFKYMTYIPTTTDLHLRRYCPAR
ncbi:lamin tail domain-containing protein 2 [Pogona vitticeps]